MKSEIRVQLLPLQNVSIILKYDHLFYYFFYFFFCLFFGGRGVGSD